MKNKSIILILFFLLPPWITLGQRKIELTPMAGYQFGGSIQYTEGRFRIDDNAVYGGILGVEIHPNLIGEFSYSYMGTHGTFTPYSYLIEPETLDLSVQYFQLGITREFGDRIKGFGLFSLGATWFEIYDEGYSDPVKFSMAFGAGAKLQFSKSVGIRLQGRLLLPMNFAGAGGYVGVGNGGATGGIYLSSWSAIVQGDFSAGLIFTLGTSDK